MIITLGEREWMSKESGCWLRKKRSKQCVEVIVREIVGVGAIGQGDGKDTPGGLEGFVDAKRGPSTGRIAVEQEDKPCCGGQ